MSRTTGTTIMQSVARTLLLYAVGPKSDIQANKVQLLYTQYLVQVRYKMDSIIRQYPYSKEL